MSTLRIPALPGEVEQLRAIFSTADEALQVAKAAVLRARRTNEQAVALAALEQARAEIRAASGAAFDPDVEPRSA
jgi:hypothetical protein